MSVVQTFSRFSKSISQAAGTPAAFILAVSLVAIWAASGPLFEFSETWQLVINTGTTIVTFLMVFLIQNSQNRDSEALQLKLDEIILSLSRADDAMIDIEQLDQKSLDAMRRRYKRILDAAENRPARTKPAGRKKGPSKRRS